MSDKGITILAVTDPTKEAQKQLKIFIQKRN